MRTTNKKTLKEYGRGIIGGLIFSLPLVYTMEVWWAGFIAPPHYLLASVGVTFLLLLGYNRYAGMKKESDFWSVCWDSVEEIGLAFFVSFIFLLLISRIDLGMSLDEISGKVIVESMVVAIGISVGTAQLGGNEEDDSGMSGDKGKEKGLLKLLILSICGAVLFASSVAPTEEILMIAIQSEYIDLLLMVLATVLLSFIILFFSDFKGSSRKQLGMVTMLSHVMIAYMIALIVSFGLLYFFGRIQNTGMSLIIAQMIVLSIPGAIGASAGRFLIEGK